MRSRKPRGGRLLEEARDGAPAERGLEDVVEPLGDGALEEALALGPRRGVRLFDAEAAVGVADRRAPPRRG